MRIRVEVAPEAQEQLERLERWWRQNRPAAPTLVVDELERLVGMIAETPEIGVPYAQGGLMNVRRLRLRRTPYLLYYHSWLAPIRGSGLLDPLPQPWQGPQMLRLLFRTVVWLVRAGFRARDDLVLENLALQEQLAIYKDKRPRSRLTDPARAFWVGLRAAWPHWRNALILLEQDTVVWWLKWIGLTIITLGIYLFWVSVSLERWIVEHTDFADGLPVYLPQQQMPAAS